MSGDLNRRLAVEATSVVSGYLHHPIPPVEGRGLEITYPMVIGCEFRVAKPGGGFYDNGST